MDGAHGGCEGTLFVGSVSLLLLLENRIDLTLGFSSPEREQPAERDAPITYTSLQPRHLPQVHDILARSFWAGIDGMSCPHTSPSS